MAVPSGSYHRAWRAFVTQALALLRGSAHGGIEIRTVEIPLGPVIRVSQVVRSTEAYQAGRRSEYPSLIACDSGVVSIGRKAWRRKNWLRHCPCKSVCRVRAPEIRIRLELFFYTDHHEL